MSVRTLGICSPCTAILTVERLFDHPAPRDRIAKAKPTDSTTTGIRECREGNQRIVDMLGTEQMVDWYLEPRGEGPWVMVGGEAEVAQGICRRCENKLRA
jgi:hypothetical protein